MPGRNLPLSLFILLLIGVGVLPALAATDGEGNRPSASSPLDATYRFVLTLTDEDSSYDFSLTIASRHFTMNLGENALSFRGRLWPAEAGRELLEYSIEHTQWLEAEGSGRQRSGSTWEGSAYLEKGRAVEIVTFLGGSFTVSLKAID